MNIFDSEMCTRAIMPLCILVVWTEKVVQNNLSACKRLLSTCFCVISSFNEPRTGLTFRCRR